VGVLLGAHGTRCTRSQINTYVLDDLWYRASLPNADDFYITKERRPGKEKANVVSGRGVKDSLSECAGFGNKSFEFISDIYFARNNGCPGIFSLA